jgi:hypothetical protein
MIDNIQSIRTMLDFSDPDKFYMLEILMRRKDNPDLFKDAIQIACYRVRTLEQFDKWAPIWKKLCDGSNARAYLRLNRRSDKRLIIEVNKRIAEHLMSGQFSGASRAYESVMGETHSENDKTWVVDIDYKDFKRGQADHIAKINGIIVTLTDLIGQAGRDPEMKMVGTKNGFHLICRPFNLKKFKEKYPDVDVHRDNPTLLYCP